MKRTLPEGERIAQAASVPKNLEKRIAKELAGGPSLSWDEAFRSRVPAGAIMMPSLTGRRICRAPPRPFVELLNSRRLDANAFAAVSVGDNTSAWPNFPETVWNEA